MFQKNKKDCLSRLDKSSKKSIDKDIKKLVALINSKENYFTTSSCSGRILLIEKKSDKKQDARFVFAEHKKADFKVIKKSLIKLPKNDLWLKQESIILHVACKTIEDAEKLLKLIRDTGIKRAGIISLGKKIILEIIGTEAMETIIAKDGKLLVSEGYLKELVKEANKKLLRNKNKIDELFFSIKINK